ncbi:MBL fold metallo-hydrolase [Rhizohabitans arisaemae]|uniref:MBL fold metallo-hydrolase n=1 Tax=Rhizohabitans arisaemae TaxID=2720610 RepID=UPI0024B285AC|nr:MBL fold metallo-hydrolase [Rhizohabitans arisaemae]
MKPAEGLDGSGTPHATCVLAPNPSPLTLDGTNSWILAEPGAQAVLVVDPGPDHEGHLQRIMDRVGERRVEAILLTHGHSDHSGGARRFAELADAPVRALDPRHRHGGEGLADGDVVAVGDFEVRVIGTPGHTFDSLCLWLPADASLLTGDTILGRGTTFIAPEGNLTDYLVSLDLLRGVAQEVGALLPGHGPMLHEPVEVIEGYRRHRRERLDQVREAVAQGATTPAEIVAVVYAEVDRALWPAAEMSVQAQLDYLDRL